MSLAGKLLLHLYHRPVGRLRDLWNEGGPRQRRLNREGRAAMRAAAARLPAPPRPAGAAAPLTVHLLTGERFWDQTAFCLFSLQLHSDRPLRAVIYDDGSLAAEQAGHLVRLLPGSRVVPSAEIRARLDEFLPTTRFPVLRERWANYPNIRKLIDPHLGEPAWKLVIDSDLLFFRRPAFLLDWLAAPDRPLHAIDCETSYGYSRPLLTRVAGQPLAELVNVGLCGLRGSELDWEHIEWLCRELIDAEKPSYYLEQALVAVLVAGRECAVAPAADYVTLPRPPEATACRAVMHHYVAGSKRWYFQHNWRHFLRP